MRVKNLNVSCFLFLFNIFSFPFADAVVSVSLEPSVHRNNNDNSNIDDIISSTAVAVRKEDESDEEKGGETTENDIPVFPNTEMISPPLSKSIHTTDDRENVELSLMSSSHHQNYGYSEESDNFPTKNPRQRKKKRLLRFLRNFRLDFTKFDTTCVKREGRGLIAPPVAHARVIKYIRRKNKERPRNPYAMALYECQEEYEFPHESADRMFCSKNKWVGPTPVCLPKGSLDESECHKCDQICSADEHHGRTHRITCSCYAGYEMTFSSNGTCVDIDECSKDNGGCSEICFNKPGSFQCFCPSGYRVGPDGKTCIDRNECLLRNGHGPCQDTCVNTPGSYLCSCESINGTRLSADKHSCEDINECVENDNFGCSHMCLNTFGNAFCACPTGLSLSSDDYKTCEGDLTDAPSPTTEEVVIDETPSPPPENLEISTLPPIPLDCPPGSAAASSEDSSPICVEHEDCSVDNGGCEHNCITQGSFRFCSCREGHELLNETACVDQNECSLGNGGCDQECINLLGSFYCACKEGYKLAGDQKTCQVTFCEPPPIRENTVGWECEYPSLVAFVNGDNPLIGTKCNLRCLPGYSLQPTYGYHYDRYHQQHSTRFMNTLLTPGNSEEENSIFSWAHINSITCEEDGEWKGLEVTSKYTCVSSSCPSLTSPEHGTIFPETCSSDNVPLNSQCLVLCNTGFYPKNGKIRTCSRGFHWFPEDNPLCIKLPPTPRPYIHCPSDITVNLKPSQGTAYVVIPQPQANMEWHNYVEAIPAWAKSLEWEAPPGVTQVSFIAKSPVSNETSTCQFKIHVVDREAPRVHGCPTSFEIRLFSGEGSREVWWAEPKFSDNVNLKYVQQSHTPGHALSRGNHHISYVAGDAEGNKARCSFTVTVHGNKDYEMAAATDYAYFSRPSTSINAHNNDIRFICPNLKTGRWIVHYAYYLPPGCLYSAYRSGYSAGFYSPKLYGKPKHHYSNTVSPRSRRKTLPNYYYNK